MSAPRPEQEVDRRTFLGGSDAAAVCGFGAYGKTQYSIFVQKTSKEVHGLDPATKKFLERRKRWEPVVVQMLREEFDAEIIAVNQRYIDQEHPFLAAEIDFEWADPETGEVHNGEIKTVSPFAFGEKQGWGEAGTSDIPIQYAAQVAHGLGVTGRRLCAVAAMVGLDNVVFYRVERDDEDITELRRRCVAFWRNHVLTGKAPDPQSIEDLNRMFRQDNGLEVAASSEIGSRALRLRAIKSQIDALELECESLEFDTKLAMGEHQALTIDGRKLVTWKNHKWSRFDSTALKEANAKLYREFMKSGEHRVFTILKGS